MKELTIPAGQYWIGDPCYVLGDKNGFYWMPLLNETGYFGLFASKRDQELNVYQELTDCVYLLSFDKKRDGLKAFVSSTMYGDGQYKTTTGQGLGRGCWHDWRDSDRSITRKLRW